MPLSELSVQDGIASTLSRDMNDEEGTNLEWRALKHRVTPRFHDRTDHGSNQSRLKRAQIGPARVHRCLLFAAKQIRQLV